MTILILSVFCNKFTIGIPCNKIFFEMTMTIFFSQIHKNCKFTKTKNQVLQSLDLFYKSHLHTFYSQDKSGAPFLSHKALTICFLFFFLELQPNWQSNSFQQC